MELILLFILMSLYTLIKGVDDSTLRCGIFGGFSNYLSDSEIENIKTLGVISYPRGVDSTGLAFAHRKNYKTTNVEYFTDKVVSDPWGYLYHPETTKLFKRTSNIRAVIGHVRSATIGEVSKDNAHPYKFNHIIGVHNGTINELRTPGTTDSAVLYKRISEFGVKTALKPIGNGAYALVWFDTSNHSINFVRNDQRPLWIMSNTTNSTFYFASERIFLNYIDARSEVTYNDPVSIEPGVIYSFNMNKSFELTKTKLSETEDKFDRKMPELNYDSFLETGTETVPDTKTTTNALILPTTITKTSDPNDPNEPPFEPDVTGPRDISILKKPIVTRGYSFDISRHKLQKPGKAPVKIDESIFSSNRDSIDKATFLFPQAAVAGSTDQFPRCCIVNGQYKRIYYKDFHNKLIDPQEILPTLEEGCLWSKVKPRIFDHIFWLNDMEFVSEEHKDDDYIKEYLAMCNNKSLVEGELVYVSPIKYQSLQKKVS